eukprot:11164518-Alexandrium_andersonii.AAC.1
MADIKTVTTRLLSKTDTMTSLDDEGYPKMLNECDDDEDDADADAGGNPDNEEDGKVFADDEEEGDENGERLPEPKTKNDKA